MPKKTAGLQRTFVFDFDSTLTQVEAFEELALISLKNDPKREEKVREIARITDMGVDGEITFTDSLERRLRILNAHRDHLDLLIKRLSRKISKSIARNKDFFKQYRADIWIISCGFKEFIDPIMAKYGIVPERIAANTFTFDKKGYINGFDRSNPLALPNGKIDQLRLMDLPGDINVIGDGFSDYQMKEAGIAHKFYAFTENVARKNILDKADLVTPSFDEFLYSNRLPGAISYPKNRIKVLLLEGIHPDAVKVLTNEGYTVEARPDSMSEQELLTAIADVSILGIRSKTHVTESVLAKADKLLAIGAFCIGTNQIDLKAARKRGVAAFNAPYSNTRSVVELALGQMIMLMRGTFRASTAMHAGTWDKSAKGSNELRGKTLGIVGYGNIGSQLSVLAEALGMNVVFYDVLEKLALGNARKAASLKEVLKKADVITLHVDGNKANTGLIGEKEFKMMKPGAVFINLSRGHVVDLDALRKHLESGHLRGAAVDVFPEEPAANKATFAHGLQGLPNVILTPHTGGSTQEAQQNIAHYVPDCLIDYINTGNSHASVNLPNIRLPEQKGAHRLLHIHHNVPGILAQVNGIFGRFGINVLGQYLKTDDEVGYLISDIDKEYDRTVVKELRAVEHTVRLRVLY